MKIALTGASGHIGGCLCRALIAKGHDVTAIVHKDDKALRGLNIKITSADILDKQSLINAFQNIEIVIHLAAYIAVDSKIPRNDVSDVNYYGTLNVIEACLKNNVRRLMHFSSIHAMEHYPYYNEMNEDSMLIINDKHIYDYTKARAETAVRHANCNTLETIILSPVSVIGPYDFKPSLLGKALISMYYRQITALVSGGYNFADVRDIVEATVNAIKMAPAGEKFILSGKYYTLKEFAQLFTSVSGVKTPGFVCPAWLAKAGFPIAQPFMKNSGLVLNKDTINVLSNCNKNISPAKAIRDLNYKIRPLENSIKDALTWFSENNYINTFSEPLRTHKYE